MSALAPLVRSVGERRLDLVAGLADGILTALTLTAGRLLGQGGGVSLDLAFRVATAAAASALFIMFVAHYADARGELVRAERQLSLTAHGRLAASRLGRAALRSSAAGAAIATACSFAGSLVPLLLGVILPGPRWLGPALTIALLGVLGAAIGRGVYGNPWVWAPALGAGGVALTVLGV
jgi:VIT1/CCC1 family predicted Fe2+/Mn2+ transporter